MATPLKQQLFINSPMENSLVNRAVSSDSEVTGRWENVLPDGNRKSFEKLKDIEVCLSPLSIAGKHIGCFFMDKGKGHGFTAIDIKAIEVLRKLAILAAG
jgi:hypothetical protein